MNSRFFFRLSWAYAKIVFGFILATTCYLVVYCTILSLSYVMGFHVLIIALMLYKLHSIIKCYRNDRRRLQFMHISQFAFGARAPKLIANIMAQKKREPPLIIYDEEQLAALADFVTGQDYIMIHPILEYNCDDNELEFVIRHELQHKDSWENKWRLALTIAKDCAYYPGLLVWMIGFGYFGSGTMFIQAINLAYVSYAVGFFLLRWVNRNVELKTDALAAWEMNSAIPAVSALEKLHQIAPEVNLQKINAGWLDKLLYKLHRTHPPHQARISSLRKLFKL